MTPQEIFLNTVSLIDIQEREYRASMARNKVVLKIQFKNMSIGEQYENADLMKIAEELCDGGSTAKR